MGSIARDVANLYNRTSGANPVMSKVGQGVTGARPPDLPPAPPPGQFDPNASGLHNTAATAQPGVTYPGQQPDLNLNLQPPPGAGPAGSADGRTKQGFFQSLMGGGIGPGRALAGPSYQRTPPPPAQWVYVPGQGPQLSIPQQGRTMSTYNMQNAAVGSPEFNAYRGNRI